jgi:hypothetical protein
MVGVSSPMYRESVRRGLRFSTSFLAGNVVAAVAITVLIVPLSAALQAVPLGLRQGAFVVFALGCALADAKGRTLFVWRQVPQRFYLQGMQPGTLGFLYGADVGLHVTTMKTTSLLWVVLAGTILLGGAVEVLAVSLTVALVISGAVFGLAVAGSHRLADVDFGRRRIAPWTRHSRWIAAGLAVSLAGSVAVGWL